MRRLMRSVEASGETWQADLKRRQMPEISTGHHIYHYIGHTLPLLTLHCEGSVQGASGSCKPVAGYAQCGESTHWKERGRSKL